MKIPTSGTTRNGAGRGGVVVVAIDNTFRRDDGVGVIVAEQARRRVPPEVEVVVLDGEPSRILDAWDGCDMAIVVDAVRTGEPAGTTIRLEVGVDELPKAGHGASSHSLGIDAAVELGRALSRLPERIVLIGVEGADFGEGPGLSDAVAAAVAEVTARVVDEVESWRRAHHSATHDPEPVDHAVEEV